MRVTSDMGVGVSELALTIIRSRRNYATPRGFRAPGDCTSSCQLLFGLRLDDKRVVDGVLLKADDLGEAKGGEQLHVEDLFDRSLEFEERDLLAAAHIKDGDAAVELV